MEGQFAKMDIQRRNLYCLMVLSAVLVVGGGCGRPAPRTVTGTVMINGKTADGVHVMFYPTVEGELDKLTYGNAITDAKGKFTVQNNHLEEGLPAGDYRVTFLRYIDRNGKTLPPNVKPDEVGGRQQVAEEYTKRDKTPEIATIPAGGKDFTFEIPAGKK